MGPLLRIVWTFSDLYGIWYFNFARESSSNLHTILKQRNETIRIGMKHKFTHDIEETKRNNPKGNEAQQERNETIANDHDY